MEIVTLYEGEFSFDNSTQGPWPTSSTTMMELSESIDNFEHIYVITCTDSRNNHVSTIVPVSSFNNDKSIRVGMYETTSQSYNIEIVKYDSLHLAIVYKSMAGWTSGYVKSVRGIRKAPTIVSSGMKYETLWEGNEGSLTSDYNTNLQLSTTINKYSKLGFELKTCNPANTNDIKIYYQECSVSQIISLINGGSGNILFTAGYGTWVNNFNIYSTSTPSNLVVELSKTLVTKIVGISEGVVVPTGVQAAKVTLWEGFNNTLNSIQTLSDNIKNYDQFEVTYANNGNGEFQTRLFNVSDINNFSGTFHCDGFASWGNPPYYFVLTFDFVSETTWKLDSVQGNGWNFGITKITGIKYIQPDSYSTEEKLIGTWVDGKPLYRKVFTNVTSPFSSGLTSSNSSVKRLYGYAKDGGDTSYLLPLPYADSQAQNYTVSINYTSATGNINVYGWRNGSSYSVIIDSIIVEYTKN